MKYFTAERYSAFQDIANDWEDSWEEQCHIYEERLKEIPLPESVRLFMNTCFLHDADFDNWFTHSEYNPVLQLVIRQRDWGDHKFVAILRFKMAPPGYASQVQKGNLLEKQETFRQKFHKGAGFSPGNPAWLYDEWDYLGKALDERSGKEIDIFSLSFLLSNGVEMEIIFTEFEFLYIPLGENFVESSREKAKN